MKTNHPKSPNYYLIRYLLGLLVGGMFSLSASVRAEPNETYSVTKVGTAPGCCFEFAIDCTQGGDDIIDYVVATVTPNTVTIASASGPGSQAPTVTPAQITYYTIGTNLVMNVPQYVEACFNNLPVTGATVTFTAHSIIDGGYFFGLGAVTVFPGADCVSPGTNCLQIACPDDVTTNCMYDDGALVVFPLPAVTSGCACGSQPVVSASWPTGTGVQTAYGSPVAGIFPIGVTPVTITAADSCGHSNTCTFSVTVVGPASPPAGSWALADGQHGASGSTGGYALTVDHNGDILVAGTFTGTATFTGRRPMYATVNNGQPIQLNAAGASSSDAFVAKYDSAGFLLWATNAGFCISGVGARGVAVDGAGNCFVTGMFEGCAFPNYPSDYCGDLGLAAFGTQDMFLAKYDPQGNLLWALNAGDSVNQVGNATGLGVAVDGEGDCYVTGEYSYSLGFGNKLNPCSPGTYFPPATLLDNGGGDAYLAKYDPNGNFIWAVGSTCPSNNANAGSRSVAVANLGGTNYAWIAGIITGENIHFGALPALSTTPAGYGNAFVVKYTDNGSNAIADWARQTTGQTACPTCDPATGTHDGRAIGVDTNGNCYFTAYFNGSATIGSLPPVTDPNPQSGSYGYSAIQLYDYLVGSFDPNGTARWIINGGQTSDNESRGLAVSPAGNVFLTGELGASGQFFSGGTNVLLNEYDSSGVQLLDETGVAYLPNSADITAGYGVAVDAGGCFYAAGTFDDPGNNAPSDPGLVFPYFPSPIGLSATNGLESMFVVKYCPLCSGGVTGCVVPPNNLVLWLPFDETNGTTSANIAPVAGRNNGTQVGGPTVLLGTYVDNSLSFNGSQYVSVPDYPAIDPVAGQEGFTLDAWVNRGTTGPDSPPSVILDKRASTGYGYSLSVDYGHVFLTLSGVNYDSSPEEVPADGQWHFVAVTVIPGSPAGVGEFYIDGNAPVPFSPALEETTNLATTAPFLVGMSVVGGNQPWQGGIDEVEMFSRALAASEIAGIYNAGPAGKCKTPATESYQIALVPGLNLIANQLDNGNNTLNALMPVAPNNSILYIYNNASGSWTTSTYSSSGRWSNGDAIALAAGDGAYFQSPTNWKLMITGTPRTPVLPVTIPTNACYLLSDQTNEVGDYATIVGTAPTVGAKIFQWSPASQSFVTASYVSSKGHTGWTSGGTNGPTAAIGEALWISPSGSATPPPPPLTPPYDGLTNTPLGAATISTFGSTLYITNLGSGGQDGLSIAIPANLSSLEVEHQALDPNGTLPIGAYLQQNTIGTGGSVTNSLLGSLTITKVGTGNYSIAANFSPIGATNYTVQGYLQGIMVMNLPNQSGPVIGNTTNPGFSDDSEVESPGIPGYPPVVADTVDWITPPHSSNPTTFTPLGSTQAYLIDHLFIIPEYVAFPTVPTSIQLVAAQIPSLTITSENATYPYGGLAATSLGNAALTLSSGALYITNLGSGGQDGLACTMPANVTALAIGWQDLDDANTLPVGAWLQAQAVGIASGITNGSLGTLTVTKAGTNNYPVTADFSPLGASNYIVEVFSNDVAVALITNHAGVSVGVSAAEATALGLETGGSPMHPEFMVDWPFGTLITLTGGSTVAGDSLLVIPQNALIAGTPDALQTTVSQVPALTLTGLNVLPAAVSISGTGQNLTLQWLGTTGLEQSSDLSNWSNVRGATSPYALQAVGNIHFYSLVPATPPITPKGNGPQ